VRKFIALILLVVPSSLFAWGNVGHRVVARIAAAHLKPAASAEVARLLGNEKLVDIATRADAIRNQRPETKESVDQQLAVAGLRLAKLINDAFATP
jgi:hypothetical protein